MLATVSLDRRMQWWHAQRPRLGLRPAPLFLCPPNKQEVFQNLVFQPILPGRTVQKLKRGLNFLRIKINSSALAKGQPEAVAQRVARRLGELNSSQAMAVQMPVGMHDGLAGHCGECSGDASCCETEEGCHWGVGKMSAPGPGATLSPTSPHRLFL